MYFLGMAVLIVLGLMWIWEVFKRFGRDLNELREGDWSSRLAVVVIWIVTTGIVAVLGRLIWNAADKIHYYF